MKKIFFIGFFIALFMALWGCPPSPWAQMQPPPVSPPLLATEEEVHQFLATYGTRYAQRDIDGFLSLFSSNAVQNQKEKLEEIRRVYARFFNQSQELRFSLLERNIELYQNAVEVQGRYRIDQKLKKEETSRSVTGQIRWVLTREKGILKILYLDFRNNAP